MDLVCALFDCRREFTPTNQRQRFCSGRCRAAASYLPIKQANEEKRLAALPQKNAEFAAFNRDRSLGFDGRYGGPTPSWHRPKPRRRTDSVVTRYSSVSPTSQREENAA